MTRCSYFYHTWTNITPEQCDLEEGHVGEHRKPQLPQPQQFIPFTGWRKH